MTYWPGLTPEIRNDELPPGPSVVPSGTPDAMNAPGGRVARLSGARAKGVLVTRYRTSERLNVPGSLAIVISA